MIVHCSAYELYADPKSDLPEDEQDEQSIFERLKRALGLAKKMELQSQTQDQSIDTPEPLSMAERFKRTFSRNNVKVHFVGAWCVIQFFLDDLTLMRMTQGYCIVHWRGERQANVTRDH